MSPDARRLGNVRKVGYTVCKTQNQHKEVELINILQAMECAKPSGSSTSMQAWSVRIFKVQGDVVCWSFEVSGSEFGGCGALMMCTMLDTCLTEGITAAREGCQLLGRWGQMRMPT